MITFKQFISEGKIETDDGYIEWNWKRDLADEEGDDYLPAGYNYNKVLELAMISVKNAGVGVGAELMKRFMASADFKKAELVFGDPSVGEGINFDSSLSDEEQLERIKRFMAKFGFRNNSSANRAWLVRKGTIDDTDLPT